MALGEFYTHFIVILHHIIKRNDVRHATHAHTPHTNTLLWPFLVLVVALSTIK